MTTGQQQFPEDQYLLSAEAEFRHLIQDDERSLKALEKALRANPRDPFLASQLARLYEFRGRTADAQSCLKTALDGNASDRRLNLRYAETLRVAGTAEPDQLAYYYRRSFTKWDHNYDAQFWYARFAFESTDPGKRGEAEEVFRHLREVRLPHDIRVSIRDLSAGQQHPTVYAGTVARKSVNYGFISLDRTGQQLFFHQQDVLEDQWTRLRLRGRANFTLGYTFSGPCATSIRSA